MLRENHANKEVPVWNFVIDTLVRYVEIILILVSNKQESIPGESIEWIQPSIIGTTMITDTVSCTGYWVVCCNLYIHYTPFPVQTLIGFNVKLSPSSSVVIFQLMPNPRKIFILNCSSPGNCLNYRFNIPAPLKNKLGLNCAKLSTAKASYRQDWRSLGWLLLT